MKRFVLVCLCLQSFLEQEETLNKQKKINKSKTARFELSRRLQGIIEPIRKKIRIKTTGSENVPKYLKSMLQCGSTIFVSVYTLVMFTESTKQ